jgi:hypothetical protein
MHVLLSTKDSKGAGYKGMLLVAAYEPHSLITSINRIRVAQEHQLFSIQTSSNHHEMNQENSSITNSNQSKYQDREEQAQVEGVMIQQSRSMTRSPSTNKVKPSRGK